MLIHRYNFSIGYDTYLVSSGGALISEAHDNFLFYFILFYFFGLRKLYDVSC